MGLLGAIGSIFSGGLTGLIGVGIKAYSQYKMRQLEYKHEEALHKYTMEQLKLEKEIALAIKDKEIEEKTVETNAEVLKGSYAHDMAIQFDRDYSKYARYGKVGKFIAFIFEFIELCMKAIRASVRPLTTYYFEAFFAYIFIKIWIMVGGLNSLPSSDVMQLFNKFLDWMLYCGTTVILWWFGGRFLEINKGGRR